MRHKLYNQNTANCCKEFFGILRLALKEQKKQERKIENMYFPIMLINVFVSEEVVRTASIYSRSLGRINRSRLEEK
jgi:hypothetical protein